MEITTDAVMENRPNNENDEDNTKDDGSNELITLVTLTSTTMTIQRGTLAMSMTTKTMTVTTIDNEHDFAFSDIAKCLFHLSVQLHLFSRINHCPLYIPTIIIGAYSLNYEL